MVYPRAAWLVAVKAALWADSRADRMAVVKADSKAGLWAVHWAVLLVA